jgi:hypothetical protein
MFMREVYETNYRIKTEQIDVAAAAIALFAQADRIATEKRNLIVGTISPAEMAGWSIKRSEAIAYQATGLSADAPSLAAEAQARGISLAALSAKVLAKAQQLAALEAAIAGRCGAIQDAAKAATSLADLSSIDAQSGWPV